MVRRVILTGFLAVVLTGTASASIVQLKNGDRVSGEILEKTEDSVKIKTYAFGEVVITRGEIASITGEDPLQEVQAQEQAAPAASPAPATAPKAWDHKLSVGYNSTNGNTKTSAANMSLDSHYKKDRSEWTIKSSLDYASDKGKMTTQKFYSKAASDVRLQKDPKWFFTRAVELNHDKFANIDYRILPSVGIGYWFWEGDASKSEFDLGIGYEYTNYNTTDTKAAGNFSLIPHYFIDKVIAGKTKVSEDLTMYPSLESFADYRLRSETALVNPLSDVLSFKVSFIDEYNSSPKANAKKNDTTLMSSLMYAF